MNVLFIIGRPAAGKTTVARRLKARIEEENPVVRFVMIDEYAVLEKSIQNLKPHALRWYADGTFELFDRTFLSKTMLELEARVLSCLQTHDLVLCELARSTYNDLFDNFDRRVKASMRILYVHAPLELCRLRNRRRRHDESRSSVPDRVIKEHYTRDDSQELVARYPAHSWVLNNSEDNSKILARAVDDYFERNSDYLATTRRAKSEAWSIATNVR